MLGAGIWRQSASRGKTSSAQLEIIVAWRDTGWGAARAHRGDHLSQQPRMPLSAGGGDALDCGRRLPRALLNRAVLHVDAGESLDLLHRAVNPIGVVAVGP
jgi:hypothetical protein